MVAGNVALQTLCMRKGSITVGTSCVFLRATMDGHVSRKFKNNLATIFG